jgi:hypothetical protein
VLYDGEASASWGPDVCGTRSGVVGDGVICAVEMPKVRGRRGLAGRALLRLQQRPAPLDGAGSKSSSAGVPSQGASGGGAGTGGSTQGGPPAGSGDASPSQAGSDAASCAGGRQANGGGGVECPAPLAHPQVLARRASARRRVSGLRKRARSAMAKQRPAVAPSSPWKSARSPRCRRRSMATREPAAWCSSTPASSTSRVLPTPACNTR